MGGIEDYMFKTDDEKRLEGALDENTQPELLIILKEPNGSGKPDFWFYNVVNDLNGTGGKKARTGAGKRFFRILGSLACAILGEKSDSEADLENALKRCAYINLYPYDGKAVAEFNNSGYSLTYQAVGSLLNEKELNTETGSKIERWKEIKGRDITSIAESRVDLLKNLGESSVKYILTVPEIFDLLCRGESKDKFLSLCYGKNHSVKEFRRCELQNGITVFEFWHPSYTRINYYNLDDAIKKSKVICRLRSCKT